MATYARDTDNLQPTALEIPEPKRTLEECTAILTAPGALHELTEATIRGRTMKVFKNAPPSISLFWQSVSSQFADREYLILEKERLTYRETHKRAIIIAEMLKQEYGVKKGDKVAVLMRNRPDWVVIFYATQLMGAVTVAVNAWLAPDAIIHCLNLSESSIVIMDDERAKILEPMYRSLKQTKLRGILVSQGAARSGMRDMYHIMKKYRKVTELPKVDIEPEDDAVIFFTSGTTNFPKAVLSTQRAFITNLFTSSLHKRRAIVRKGEDVPLPSPDDLQVGLLLPIPLFHVTGCQSLLMTTTAQGGKIVFMHKWVQKEGIRLIADEKITITGGVPFIVQEILEGANGDELKTLDTFSYGGAPCNDGLPAQSAKKIASAVMQQAYGLTETNAVVIGHAGDDYQRRPLSTGLPALVDEIRMVGKDGVDVPLGDIGELWVRGPNVFKCYYNDPKATAEAVTEDGWFKSGDLASMDHEGFVYIRDRAKDIIIRGGENIAATAVENALYRNPKVQDCAVVAVSDRKLGELPAAVVVLRSSASGTKEDEIIEDVKKYLPRHAVPVMVMLRNQQGLNSESDIRIERNANGKIVKRELKKVVEQEWQQRTKAKL